ncbi:hypothetical protein A4G18_01280 [Pasteurellaceae bacterium Pebbles2]|nr:hypothetical protein [Pasteurellaceae bacterium Pebbles2]
MSDLLKTLNNLRSLRAVINTIDLEQAESILAKVQSIVENKRQEEVAKAQEQAERQQLIEKYRNELKAKGIDVSELALADAANEKVKKARRTMPAKYKYTNENGEVIHWTGQGRMPKVMREALEKGKKLTDFAV